MMLEPERAAALMAERLRRPLPPAPAGKSTKGKGRGAAPAGAFSGDVDAMDAAEMRRDWLVQRTLEELGIHCEANDTLQDLKGFLIASPRGADIVVSDR